MATEIRMPQFGVSMETGTIVEWRKAVGDTVKSGDVLAGIETEKLTNDVVCEVDGVVLAIVAQEGEDIPVQGLLAVVGQPGEVWQGVAAPAGSVPAVVEEKAAPAAAVPVSAAGRVKASPLARKVAKTLHVELACVAPGGTSGRVKAADVYAYAEKQAAVVPEMKEPDVSAFSAAAPFPVKKLPLMDGDTVEKLAGMRKVVAQRMFASACEIPRVTQTMKINMTALDVLRKQLNAQREQKLSINDFILKAVAKALRKCPFMLVSLDGEQIIHRAHVNLGMAVALDNGLIVPVLRDADKMGLQELSACARELALRARSGGLTTDEYKDSTFTVSNLGMYGIESFTPIINQPDAAILGVNAMEDELYMQADGTVGVRKVMRICLTYDHRLIDGALAAEFECVIRDLLEAPMEILL